MKDKFFKIEKNVPLAKWTRGSKKSKTDPEIEALLKLEPGESVKIPYTIDQKNRYRVKLHGLQKTIEELSGKELTVNAIPEDGGFLRVWYKN